MPQRPERGLPALWCPLRAGAVLLAILVAGCSVNNAKKNYVLAEKFWSDGQYSAAVVEFERAFAKDPKGKVGQQALYRGAATQAFFLSEYPEAIRKLKTYVEVADEPQNVWEARKLIGELLFSKLEEYDHATQHYRALVQADPKAPEVPEFLYRIGKSRFFLGDFDEAVAVFRQVMKNHPKNSWGERSAYEIGVTYFTRGDKNSTNRGAVLEIYEDAIDAFEEFLKQYPNSAWVPEAKFGIASCLEELDQLDAAYQAYEGLLQTYPSPKVIQIKLERIRQRKAHRNR